MTLDIALPFYGDVGYLKQTVASVIDQSDPDWRLIVVDDGYPDDSIPGWFSSLGDSRITYQRNVSNLGANGNFQKCLKLVSAEFCVVMGADDILDASFVSRVKLAISEHPEASMIHPRVVVIDESNREVSTRADQIKSAIHETGHGDLLLSGESLAASLMRGNWMYFPAITWRTKTIQEIGFREGFHVCQDLGLAMDLIMRGGVMVQIDDPIFKYRRHLASDSSTKALDGSRFLEEREFFKVMKLELQNLGWNKAATAAHLHLTSRLHAASLIPKAIRSPRNVWNLLRHTFSL